MESEPASLGRYAVGGCHFVVGTELELARVGGEDREAEVACHGLTGIDRDCVGEVGGRRRAFSGEVVTKDELLFVGPLQVEAA